MGNWQPIDTAPKDGTEILVFVPPAKWSGGYVRSVMWVEDSDHSCWCVEDNKLGPFALRGGSPTHWMQLPEPPAIEEPSHDR